MTCMWPGPSCSLGSSQLGPTWRCSEVSEADLSHSLDSPEHDSISESPDIVPAPGPAP